MKKKILYALLIVLVVIQFIRPEKNLSSGPYPNDITTKYAVPAPVLDIVKRSCYDCHSNNTSYPWYNNIQPVASWMGHHVNEGKGEFNFNEFASYPAKKARHKLEELADEVNEGGMPMSSYTWIHKDAILDAGQKKLVSDWAQQLAQEIATANNLPAEEKRPQH
jgi:hypothetical protein